MRFLTVVHEQGRQTGRDEVIDAEGDVQSPVIF